MQHAGTLVSAIGASTVPAEQVILKTEAGPRNVTGANQDVSAERDTGNKCNVGDIVKYVNLFIEVGPKLTSGQPSDRTGWLEWAFCCVKESETNVPITTVGVQTLATVCTNMFRNECIFTGAIPIGNEQANFLPITIKIPKTKSTIRIGDEWRFITSFRAVDSASVSTGVVALIKSFMYRGYQ